MFRKRRQPAPFFNMPGAPYNPATGENAPLGTYPPRGTTLALFQVVAADTHDNYIVCRGHEADDDPNFRFLHDPYTVPTTTPINVAKPYSVRGTFPYELGQVIVAARIKGKLGYNPGKAVTVGQPADLDEVISLLTDDDDVGIAWLDVSTVNSTTPAWAANNDGVVGISSGTGSTTQDVDFPGTAIKTSEWTASGDELIWNGANDTEFLVSISTYMIPQTGAPSSDTKIAFGLRIDSGSGYPSNMTMNEISDAETAFNFHVFRSGIAPPNNTMLSATRWLELNQGDKVKVSVQKKTGGDSTFAVSFYRTSVTFLELKL